MKILILYDTQYNNTEKIAKIIASAIPPQHKCQCLGVEQVQGTLIHSFDVIIFGSPTHGGRPKAAMQEFFDAIPADGMNGKMFAVFDTRFLDSDVNIFLRLLMRTIGYAGDKMADFLKSRKGILLVPPEGFIVTGKSGPLAKGEDTHARNWATLVVQSAQKMKSAHLVMAR